MANIQKYGTHWTNDELDAIVEDYFSMLAEELSGRPYIKSRHSSALMARIGRSHRSVEFKHQNISAVLLELGLPWIIGYKPKSNYQNAIFDAIDRYLTFNRDVEEVTPTRPLSIPATADLFVPPPSLSAKDSRLPARLARLVKKFDPVQRDYRNRTLGKAGEAFVYEFEKRRLEEGRRADLSRQVRWIADEDGDGAGFDVLSYDLFGSEQFIEVKTTNGAARTPFFLTRNEYEVSVEKSSAWQIYRVHLFATSPHIFTISAPLESAVILRPETWRASF